jgi:hypothetical protein
MKNPKNYKNKNNPKNGNKTHRKNIKKTITSLFFRCGGIER